MKSFVFVLILLLADCSPVCHARDAGEDAAVLKAFTMPVPMDGGPIWATILTDRTADILWHDASSKESLRSDAAASGLSFYIMGLATRDIEVVPSYIVIQDGVACRGKAVNIRNLSGGFVRQGEVFLGTIAFEKKIDLVRPFTFQFSGCSVEIVMDPDAVKRWGARTVSQESFGGPPPE